jgi:hypothetical protein
LNDGQRLISCSRTAASVARCACIARSSASGMPFPMATSGAGRAGIITPPEDMLLMQLMFAVVRGRCEGWGEVLSVRLRERACASVWWRARG